MADVAKRFDSLATYLSSHPISIEILPGDGSAWLAGTSLEKPGSPFLFMEKNLGVPQKFLYEAYLFSLKLFKPARNLMQQSKTPSPVCIQNLIASTAVILLANPAHQTALNTRKRLIQRNILDIEEELAFTAALLSSQHCAKESTLWHHRRWLYCRHYGLDDESGPMASNEAPHQATIPLDKLEVDMKLCSRACELYTRNYFAWAHRRFCMNHATIAFESVSPRNNIDASEHLEMVATEISNVKRWIDQHVSDYSAVHYLVAVAYHLHFLMIRMSPPHITYVRQALPPELLSLSTHATSLLKAYPDHESLWLYLRAVTQPFACNLNEGQPVSEGLIRTFIRDFVNPLAFSTTDVGSPSSEKQVLSKSAYRYLAWCSFKQIPNVDDLTLRLMIAAEPAYRPTIPG